MYMYIFHAGFNAAQVHQENQIELTFDTNVLEPFYFHNNTFIVNVHLFYVY